MPGGSLAVSRYIECFPDWTEDFGTLGFYNVFFTNREHESLNSLIRDFKPRIVLMGSLFYGRATPFMMKRLLKVFPYLNIAVINIHECPDELAMNFILNGVHSYVNQNEGKKEYNRGLTLVRDGEYYVSPGVKKRINMRDMDLKPAGDITDRRNEVLQLMCKCFKDEEICETLNISRSTVDNHKTEIFRSLNVRNVLELYIVAHRAKLIPDDDIDYFPRNFTVTPKPDKKSTKRKKKPEIKSEEE